jgi:type II secretion system protein N
MKPGLKFAAYFVFFDICFVVAAVVMFPLQGLRPLIVDEAEKALGKGKQGRNGVDPVVTIGDLAMSGLGVKATRVQVQLANSEPEPGPTIDLDSVWLSASLRSLVSSTKTVQLEAELYEGDVEAEVSVDDKLNVVAAHIDVDEVRLGRVGAIIGALGAPVDGKVKADIDVELGATAEKDASGTVDITVADLSVGPGTLKVVPGGFELADAISLGTLVLKAPVEKGQGTLQGRFEGAADIEAELTGTLGLRGKLPTSRLDVDGWFRPTAGFLEKNPKIKSAIELGEKLSLPGAPSLSKAKDAEGRYHFEARGALQAIKPQLSRDAGRRTSRKRAPLGGSPSDGASTPGPGADKPIRPARPELSGRPPVDEYKPGDVKPAGEEKPKTEAAPAVDPPVEPPAEGAVEQKAPPTGDTAD